MVKFINRVLLFIFIVIAFVSIDVGLQKMLFFQDENMKIPKKKTVLILGHSHPSCALNTQYIPIAFNASSPGEAYIYTYFKAKKLIDCNPQIKKVYIEYTNNTIGFDMDEWIWGDAKLQHNFVAYGVLLDWEALQLLYQKNPSGLVTAFSKGLFNNIGRLFSVNKSYNEGYVCVNKTYKKVIPSNPFRNRSKAQKGNTVTVVSKKGKPTLFEGLSIYNIRYLQKLVQYCKAKNIDVCLMRSPMHRDYDVSNSEAKFKLVLKHCFGNLEFIDNKDFPIPNNGFQDKEHLNFNGATIYSQYFNHQMMK